MPKYGAAIDQGTTSTRFIIFDHGGNIVAVDQKEHQQIYPKPGWVEHDPLEIWARTQEVMRGAFEKAGCAAFDIASIGITNQRETTVVWDRQTGALWRDDEIDAVTRYLNERYYRFPCPAAVCRTDRG